MNFKKSKTAWQKGCKNCMLTFFNEHIRLYNGKAYYAFSANSLAAAI